MKITTYGTCGSVPVCKSNRVKHGGNTTCIRIHSRCLPEGYALGVDAGSGIVPMSLDLLIEGAKNLTLMFTHLHHDHTQGLFLSPHLHNKEIPLNLWCPVDQGIGPKQMMADLMKPPYFPVHVTNVESHITYWAIEHPTTWVIAFHPQGGCKRIKRDQYERLLKNGRQLPFDSGIKFPISECLIVTMHKSNHPEQAISYRFEEKPTGKVFVFLTDHENEDGLPASLKAHLTGADLLLMDCQYSREKYDRHAIGFGHATPDYCVTTALKAKVKRLGLTHHDFTLSDDQIDGILNEGLRHLESLGSSEKLNVFSCKDYDVLDV